MEEVRDNFNKIYEILIKSHKRTFISKQMGFTSTCQLSNSLEGKATLSSNAIYLLIKNFNVNPTFLYLGIGDIFLNSSKSDFVSKPFFYYSIT